MKSAPTVVSANPMALVVFGVFLTAGPSANAELWRSPLHDLTYVQVEKRILAEG